MTLLPFARFIRLVPSKDWLSLVCSDITLAESLIDATTTSYLISWTFKLVEQFLSLDVPGLLIRFSLELLLLELFLVLKSA